MSDRYHDGPSFNQCSALPYQTRLFTSANMQLHKGYTRGQIWMWSGRRKKTVIHSSSDFTRVVGLIVPGISLAQNFEEILGWLDGLNCAEKQDVTLLLRQPDTCKWLFDTIQYKMWRDRECSCLWLCGKRKTSAAP